MRKVVLIFLFFLIWLVGFNPLMAQDAGFTGYGTCQIRENQTVLTSFGYKNYEKTERYDSLTLQPVGSVSKIIIGLSMLKAMELGYLHIDSNINKYLDFGVINPNLNMSHAISLRHLATHTSGIKDVEKFYLQSYTNSLRHPESLGDYLKSYLTPEGSRFSKNNFGKGQPGMEYNYSNIGAALAAYVIEKAVKMPFSSFSETYVLKPLGMNHSHWFYNETRLPYYTQLFDEKDKPLPLYSLATYPDGGLKTNLVDMSKLLGALIYGYSGKGKLLLESSWKLLFEKNFSDKNPVKNINPKEPNSGLFVIYAKSGMIGHTGSDPGLCSFLFFNPENGTGKIFMANEDLTPANLAFFREIWEKL